MGDGVRTTTVHCTRKENVRQRHRTQVVRPNRVKLTVIYLSPIVNRRLGRTVHSSQGDFCQCDQSMISGFLLDCLAIRITFLTSKTLTLTGTMIAVNILFTAPLPNTGTAVRCSLAQPNPPQRSPWERPDGLPPRQRSQAQAVWPFWPWAWAWLSWELLFYC